ncbi:hypothetical protein GALL_243610 [mine drainage metagenome]|uniref:Uncharacterized protein n=1 Tax=mine drainage metagenome TaxID=410659 RepID=A0A1J5RC62_9ZZZZ
MTDEDLDRLLRHATPVIGADRIERVSRAVLLRQARLETAAASWFTWLTARASAAYCALFVLGCVVNVALHQGAAARPDLLAAVTLPSGWGG